MESVREREKESVEEKSEKKGERGEQNARFVRPAEETARVARKRNMEDECGKTASAASSSSRLRSSS